LLKAQEEAFKIHNRDKVRMYFGPLDFFRMK